MRGAAAPPGARAIRAQRGRCRGWAGPEAFPRASNCSHGFNWRFVILKRELGFLNMCFWDMDLSPWPPSAWILWLLISSWEWANYKLQKVTQSSALVLFGGTEGKKTFQSFRSWEWKNCCQFFLIPKPCFRDHHISKEIKYILDIYRESDCCPWHNSQETFC